MLLPLVDVTLTFTISIPKDGSIYCGWGGFGTEGYKERKN